MPFPLVLVHHGGQFLLQFLVQQPHIGTGDTAVLTLCGLRVLRDGLCGKGSITPELGAYSLFNRLLVLVVGQRQSPLYGHLRRFGDGLWAKEKQGGHCPLCLFPIYLLLLVDQPVLVRV